MRRPEGAAPAAAVTATPTSTYQDDGSAGDDKRARGKRSSSPARLYILPGLTEALPDATLVAVILERLPAGTRVRPRLPARQSRSRFASLAPGGTVEFETHELAERALVCVQEVEVTAENDPAGLNVLSLSQEPLRQQHSEQSSFRLDVKGAMTCAELYDRASAFGSLVALTGWNQLVYADREAAKKARASLDGLKLDEDDVLRVNWASSQPSSPPQRSPRQAQGSGPAKERKKQGERHRSKKQNEDAQSPKQGGASERKETQGDKIGDKAEEGKSPSSRRAVAPHLLQPKRSVFGAAIQAIHQDQPVASPSREEVVAAQPVATEVTPNEDTPETWTVVSPPPSSPPLQEVVAAKKPSADDDAVPTVSAEDAAVSTPASPPVSPPQQTDHERLVSAVRTLPSSLVATERLPALISLLEALPRRDVKLCLLNSAVLEQKVHDALDVLDAMDEEDAQEPVEDVEAAEAAEAVVADDKVPAKLDTLPEDVNELANVSALEIVQLLEKAATSTPSAYCCGAAGSPVTAKAIQETDAFVDDLERSGVSAMIRKQRVGDRVHRVVKSFGLKPAPRITINLLDTEDVRSLARLALYPEILRVKVQAVAEQLAKV